MSWYSILPPLIAILVVFWRKEVIMALLLAVVSSEFLLLYTQGQSGLLTFINSVERVISVATSAGNSRILIFSIVIGALLAYIRESGGVAATVNKLMNLGVAKSKRQVGLLTMFTGTSVFIESNMSVLTSGIVSRGLFDKFKMSRARLAYIIDSTSAPVCILILLNGWGAYVLGLLSNYELEQSAVSILWSSVAFNFYAIIALLIVLYTIVFDKVHGPMKEAEQQLEKQNLEIDAGPAASKARFMLVPLLTLIVSMVGFMFWTGNGELASGSGSKSVLYATVLASMVAYLQLIAHKQFTHHELVDIGFKGMGELLPLVSIVLLSLTLGASLKDLGTGQFVASLVGDYLPIYLIVPVLFLTGAVMSFTTGTSWGTFAILIPIGVPLIQALGLPAPLVVGAILSGGIFGDHCSPISDTSAVSALASGCDLLTHVKTQLPYALVGGLFALISFFVASLIMI
ncbi:MAG: Na+/H+ antiporter NhaC family protein [Pseudomonadota bacterium]|uniref:Na+/H+ antiporter NhaC family protein n=1 Tax=Pseudoalteromonas phenolica TaxID=161398 RepID=UPI000C0B3F71|nr:sodium:proton antiporter [Pseudoalteromonas sp.]|tara:strand:- start:1984 stop:3357 length:1374 start_codon:yes stop_codon:yes gene_type:complete